MLATAALFLLASTSEALEPGHPSTILYVSANGERMSFEKRVEANGKSYLDIGTGDSSIGAEPCKAAPAFVCVDVGAMDSLYFAVPRDIEQRLPATLREMDIRTNPAQMAKGGWVTGGFEFHVESIVDSPHGDIAAWQPIGFAGKQVRALKVVVFDEGKVDRRYPKATFLYNPQVGVIAFDYPYGHEQGGIEFRSYWLESNCGLIPIASCHLDADVALSTSRSSAANSRYRLRPARNATRQTVP